MIRRSLPGPQWGDKRLALTPKRADKLTPQRSGAESHRR